MKSNSPVALERIAHARLSIYRAAALETAIWKTALADAGNATSHAEHRDRLAKAYRLIASAPAVGLPASGIRRGANACIT